MREWCGCGAAVYAPLPYLIREWRREHRCTPKPEELQVPPTGASSLVELSQSATWVDDRIGFKPNP